MINIKLQMVEANRKSQREVRWLSATARKPVLLSTEVKENSACFCKTQLVLQDEKKKGFVVNPSRNPSKRQEGRGRERKLGRTFFLSLTCPVMMATTYIFRIRIVL